MKTTKKIVAAVLSMAVMGSLAVFANAEEAPAGHIIFAADKNTIGQGFVVEPVKVPYYEGEKGIEVIQRAADVIVTESDYGDYISAFADTDTGEEIPEEIAAVCPEMFGRTAEGYLSAYDYTAESGWSYFVNNEYAMVGISDYVPADGDVVWFRFTVYGYGSDLGIDNSSWGGTPALVEQTKTASLMKCLAENTKYSDQQRYKNAIKTLETYGATQVAIDTYHDRLQMTIWDLEKAEAENKPSEDTSTPSEDVNTPSEDTNTPSEDTTTPETPDAGTEEGKGSPDTGAEGIAAIFGIALTAGAALALSKKR